MLRTKQQQHQYQLIIQQDPGMNEQATAKGAKTANGAEQRPLQLHCIDKIHEIPVLDLALGAVGGFYGRLKKCSSVTEWSLGVAERQVNSVLSFSLSSAVLKMPLGLADSALCYSLSVVEGRLPAIKRQPRQLLGLVSEKAEELARPVVVRANSVKQLAARSIINAREYGLQRADQALNTRVGSIASDSIDVGLQLAEHLIDTYLPPESTDETIYPDEDEPDARARSNSSTTGRALYKVNKADRLTRVLQRRLTRRTLQQVKSLRETTMDAVAFILGVAKTVVSDPKGSAEYMIQLWRELSRDEPENQTTSEHLEDRVTLLARETARRLVHVVNAVYALPVTASNKLARLLFEILHSLRLDGPTHIVVQHTRSRYHQLTALITHINSVATQILVSALQKRQQQHQRPDEQPVQNEQNNQQQSPVAFDQANNHV